MRIGDLIFFLRRLAEASVVPADAGGRSSRGLGAFWRKRPVAASRGFLTGAALVACVLVGAWFPQIAQPLKALFAAKEPAQEAAARKGAEGLVRLSAEQIAAAKIATAKAGPGVLTRMIAAPAIIAVDPDRVGRVAAKVSGTVAELRKKLGDEAAKGEVIAVIDSREVADAKSEYLAASVNYDLQNTLFQREKGLFEKKITAEQLYLKAKTTFAEAKLRLDLARQKLASLDLSEAEIVALPQQPVGDLRRKEIHAPISGRVIERRVNLGQPVGGEGQEKELYVLADLSTVWAEISVPIHNLADIHEKQAVTLSHGDEAARGRIVFVSPVLDHETHSGRVIATFDNKSYALRPGTAMTARVALSEKRVGVRVPRSAVQTIDGDAVVFVRVADGFAKRKVETGQGDDDAVEIVAGLEPGETIAVTNTFVLKGEIGKADLESLD